MSSIDQAFVKAFARRQARQATCPEQNVADSPTAERPQDPADFAAGTQELQRIAEEGESFGSRGVEQRQANLPSTADPATPTRASGNTGYDSQLGLTIDQSVAESTAMWIDAEQGQQLRADRGTASTVPQPQFSSRPGGGGVRESVTSGSPSALTSAARSNQDPLASVYNVERAEYALGTMAEDLVSWGIEPQTADHSDTANAPPTPGEPDPPTWQPSDGVRIDGGHVAPATLTPEERRPTSYRDGETDPSAVPDATDPTSADDSDTALATTSTEAQAAGATEQDAATEAEDFAEELAGADAVTEASTTTAAAQPFRAVWEVDAFDVPAAVSKLFFTGPVAEQVSTQMSQAIQGGLRSMLITSVNAGEGRSTVASGIAFAVAASGHRVALIDANAASPTLADDLRLDVEYGWLDAFRGGLPIEEVAIHSIGDGVTLIPLMPPQGSAATREEIETVVQRAKQRFDLVVVDGPAGLSAVVENSEAFDTALIVRDLGATSAAEINALSYRLREHGVQGVGVVENFH